ncbi:RNA polymerase sigma-70 factor [Jejuia pallidilutea]|uniref:RNA polymerase sigma-70 factor n=2 Tax=Jejuia pallidilutea TaxID=504487 RepID=A0A090VV05_9FLAO|nr:RNA polymerase sigma-70 factor [Jejuia pallidilutea]GAL72968.1 RNA polymerase sigma-70 factor [Jejuia pallidilutea]
MDEPYRFFGKSLTFMRDNKALIYNLKNKDEAALSQLYDAYAPAIYGVILRICKDEQEAQNLLQDTFLTIWDKSHQYNPDKAGFILGPIELPKIKH